MRRIIKTTATLLGATVLGGAGYLYIAPPDLLKVGTNYSAKIVCSNVFIAGRDGQEVLEVDVQAPGHPLLKHISLSVDHDAKRVTTRLFGVLATAQSQYRDGLGCTNLHDSALSDTTLTALPELPAAPWPAGNEVTPADNPALMAALSDKALLGDGFRAAVVVKDGQIVGEAYGDGFDANAPLLGWSMTKTVTAGLIGTLIASGDMTLDDTLTDSYGDWSADGRSDITVADMLAMASGLQWNEGYGDVSDVTRMLYLSDDMAGFAATLPLEAPIGGAFTYSSGTSTLLSRVWQDKVAGDSIPYPQKALFGPLGMTSAVMETDAADTYVGSSYMYATARDWARFGQLLAQDGTWNGAQILPQGFAAWMMEPVAVSGGDYTKGHIWREAPGGTPPFEDSVWLSGHDGQTIGVFPDRNLVIVRMGLTPSDLDYSSLPLAKAVIAALEG